MTTAIYRNPFTFLEAPWYRDLPGAEVVISGIPFDLATSGRAGSRSGPGAIRQASANLVWDSPRWRLPRWRWKCFKFALHRNK